MFICQVCSPFHQCKLWDSPDVDPVDDFFFDMFFCCRPCLHKKAPGGDHCSEGRVDVCSAQYSSDTFSHPFDIGVVIS